MVLFLLMMTMSCKKSKSFVIEITKTKEESAEVRGREKVTKGL